MKFVDFGDLVEVTYDDGNVELVSKEEACSLGYKEQQELQIAYQGQIYNGAQFSKLVSISCTFIRTCYKKGLRTGEEILDAYKKAKNAKQEIQITYQGKIYNGLQFSELTRISVSCVSKYYTKGLRTGEEILDAYKKAKNAKQEIQITYQGKIYNGSQFGALTGISAKFIRICYNKGLRTGEKILTYHSCSRQNYSISYQGDLYTAEQFSAYTDIPVDTIRIYRREGLTTGEEMLARYIAIPKIRITYNGNVYNSTQLSKLTGISSTFIGEYYKKGLCTGEEIIEAYNKQKMSRQKIKIAYQGKVYDSTQFSKLTGICAQTIGKYYKKGLRTGEEMIAYYNRNKQ